MFMTERPYYTLKNERANNKAFEHANLIFTEPWALANEIILMQNFKFDFFKNEF